MIWTRKCSHPAVGVKLLDRDHDDLTEILDEIRLRSGNGLADGPSGEMLRKLARRMHVHFALEESMMSASKYPGAAVHRLQHQWLMDQVNALARQRGHNSLARTMRLLNLLTASHHSHIGHEDLDYGMWLGTALPRPIDAGLSAPIMV